MAHGTYIQGKVEGPVTDEVEKKAWVRDSGIIKGIRAVFIRLIPRGPDAAGRVHNTIDARSASIDVDKDGNILGVTLFLDGLNGEEGDGEEETGTQRTGSQEGSD